MSLVKLSAGNIKLSFRIASIVFRLLEVLELPQLAETCVRNGHYEEALELKQYVTRLNKKLGSIPIVTEVVQVRNKTITKTQIYKFYFLMKKEI
jgi:hypothetical protein